MGNGQLTIDEWLEGKPGDLTLGQAFELFESVYMAQRNLSAGTRREYKTDIRQLRDFLAKYNLTKAANIQLGHLQAFLADGERRGFDATTRYRKCYSIKAFFGFLASNKLTLADPAKRLIPPRRPYKQPHPLTPQQTQALLRACSDDPRASAIIQLILQTGLRLSEIARLTTYNVELPAEINDETSGALYVRKGRKEERFSLDYKACRALHTWLFIRPNIDHPALFITKFQKPMRPRGFQRVIEKYAKLAGIPKASPRTLRQTYDVQRLQSTG